MKRMKISKLFILFLGILSTSLLTSCGGDDSKEAPIDDIMWPEKYNFLQTCQVFGLNSDDYDIFSVVEFDGQNVAALYNKNNNSVFVGVWDANTKKGIYSNKEVKANPTETYRYYENTYECKLDNFRINYIEKSGGFFLEVEMVYKDGTGVSASLPVFFIVKGSNTFMMGASKIENSYSKLMNWYDDSCIISLNDETYCYTVEGKEVFMLKGKPLPDLTLENDSYLVSYEDCISLRYDLSKHILRIKRRKLTSDTDIFTKDNEVFKNMSDNVKVTYSYEKVDQNVVVTVKAIEVDGKTETVKVNINLETNEVVLIS